MIGAGVQETLFFPLLGRARAARSWPSCFQDSWSERLVSMVSAFRPGVEDMDMGEMPAAVYALRHLAAVTEIRRYLDTHPEAAVVDLGCGLDRLVDEVDNGRALIYNLDFPDVLESRRTWVEPHERERELPFSFTDHRWMDEVDASGGLIAVASGVFYFLETSSVRDLVNAMSHRLPGGRLVYDSESPEMVAMSEQAVRDRGGRVPLGADLRLRRRHLRRLLRAFTGDRQARRYRRGRRHHRRPVHRRARHAADDAHLPHRWCGGRR